MGNLPASNKTRSSRSQTAAGQVDAPVSIADALFTTTQQRVFGLLFGQPARSFFGSELIELTGSGSGAVQRELKRLVSSGLVTVHRVGKQKHYQANADSPVFAELCSLMTKTVALVEPIRTALQAMKQAPDLALLYGSFAKGHDTASSDIDLLVVGNKLSLEALYAVLAPVEKQLDRKINPTLYTKREFVNRKAQGNAFLARVLSGEHIVLITADDESPAT